MNINENLIKNADRGFDPISLKALGDIALSARELSCVIDLREGVLDED